MLGRSKTPTAATEQFCTNNSDRQSHLHSFCTVQTQNCEGAPAPAHPIASQTVGKIENNI